MKKVISSLLAVSMLVCSMTAKADNITLEQAKSASAYFMGQRMGADKLTSDNLTLVHQIDNAELNIPAAYFFNVNGCGWIIMAGTTTIDPIVAYSDEGSLDMDNLPVNMMTWLNGYADMISEIQVLDLQNDYPDDAMWTRLSNHKAKARGNQHVLMSEKWGQGDDRNPTYNLYCPKVGNRWSVVGCVATALAQICHYYRYPVQPRGDKYYWWNNTQLEINYDTVHFNYSLMPNRLTANSLPEKVREVAKLSYSLGVAVEMDYDPDGSGTSSQYVPTAMFRFFKYQRGSLVSRNGNNDTAFVAQIRSSLLQGYPVYMSAASTTGSGADAAGHAFVVAGYEDGTEDGSKYGYYFFNWGWEGGGDGFYNLGANNMPIQGYGYNFTERQQVVIGMMPPADTLNPVSISPVELDVLGSAYPNPASFSVKIPYVTSQASDLLVYSIDGRLVESHRVNPGSGEYELRVDALPKGIYIYRMNSQSGKFIVQ